MKRAHIIAIAIIAVGIAALIGSLSDSSTYADLDEAFANTGREFHVVGTLDRTLPIVYEPVRNASLTQFAMQDLNGRKCTVHLQKAKPQDLERSERLVLIGEATAEGHFIARDMLMKCPSKYNEANEISAL